MYTLATLSTIQVLGKKEESLNETSLSQMIEPLEGLLQCQGLMTDRLEASPLCTCYAIDSLIFELSYSLYFLLFIDCKLNSNQAFSIGL